MMKQSVQGRIYRVLSVHLVARIALHKTGKENDKSKKLVYLVALAYLRRMTRLIILNLR
jgi:hypothetical protein